MYIKTEENKIINLNHYRSIEVYGTDDGYYLLRAIRSVGFEDKTKSESIITFDDEEKATKALDDLFVQIDDGRTTWNANEYKNSVGTPTPILQGVAERKYP